MEDTKGRRLVVEIVFDGQIDGEINLILRDIREKIDGVESVKVVKVD